MEFASANPAANLIDPPTRSCIQDEAHKQLPQNDWERTTLITVPLMPLRRRHCVAFMSALQVPCGSRWHRTIQCTVESPVDQRSHRPLIPISSPTMLRDCDARPTTTQAGDAPHDANAAPDLSIVVASKPRPWIPKSVMSSYPRCRRIRLREHLKRSLK